MSDTFALKLQHSSLRFSDSHAQHVKDAKTLFDEGGDYPIKTGTEAGPVDGGADNRQVLSAMASEYNHIINFGADTWVAVDRAIIVPNSVKREDVFLVSNDKMVGHGTDRVMSTLSFEHRIPGVGHIAIGSVHYPVNGAEPGDPNYNLNKLCARKIAQWMQANAQGYDLAFVNGDFNTNDRDLDFALGEDFTSLADFLKAWENTGHGPIDGFAKYDKDKRVTARSFKVLNDQEMHMFSDHFVCRGVWEVEKRFPKS